LRYSDPFGHGRVRQGNIDRVGLEVVDGIGRIRFIPGYLDAFASLLMVGVDECIGKGWLVVRWVTVAANFCDGWG